MTRAPEQWKAIPSAPHWFASDWGRIKRELTLEPMPNGGVKELSVAPTYGHLDTKKRRFKHTVIGKTRWVAPLVCEAFYGPKPTQRHECMHVDEDSLNDKPINLAWGTRSQNQMSPKVQGWRRERHRGASNNLAKLTDDKVREMRALNLPYAVIARMFGVSQPTASAAIRGETWGHVK